MAAPDTPTGPDEPTETVRDDDRSGQTEDVEGLDPLEGLMDPEDGVSSPAGDAAAPPPG